MELFVMPGYPGNSTTGGGTCSRCGSSQRIDSEGVGERVVHTGMWIEMEGSLVFCEPCVAEMGHAIGMIYESKARATKADVSRAERRERVTKEAKNEILEAKKAIDELVGALNLG